MPYIPFALSNNEVFFYKLLHLFHFIPFLSVYVSGTRKDVEINVYLAQIGLDCNMNPVPTYYFFFLPKLKLFSE